MSISKESGRVWVQMPADEDMEGGNCSTSFDSIYFLIKKIKSSVPDSEELPERCWTPAESMKCENVRVKWIGTTIVWLSYVSPCGEEV